MIKKVKIGIAGASGYAGWELFQIMQRHPHASVGFATSESYTGKALADIWTRGSDMHLQSISDVDFTSVDCVFLCLPHTTSAPYAMKAVEAGCAVVDLSADLRLENPDEFKRWYQAEHAAPALLPVVYGLPEHNRERIQGQTLVANPGCYPTAVLLGLLPLAKAELILPDAPLIVDAKSGTTGAGRKAKPHLLHSEISGNFTPYKIGRNHQHIGEMEQALEQEGIPPGNLIFSPHLLPVERGILAALYVSVSDPDGAADCLRDAYRAEPLVHVLSDGELATLAHVVRTPYAVLSATIAGKSMLIIQSAIDNLLKGAASQAVQNFNLMFGFSETTALMSRVEK